MGGAKKIKPIKAEAVKRQAKKKSPASSTAKRTVKRVRKTSATNTATPVLMMPEVKNEVTKIQPLAIKQQEFALASHLTKAPTDEGYWHSLLWFMVLLLGILGVTGGAVWLQTKNFSQPNSTYAVPSSSIPTAAPPETSTAPLTGLPISSDALTQRPWAVVVENFPVARPQSGLSSADIIFETPTEGGITRHLAIFQSRLPDRVGPVRSARPYFNDIARSFGALFSHSGGSSEALAQLQAGYGGITDVNEFFNEQAYERDSLKKAPHNLFTSASRFFTYAGKKGLAATSSVPPMNFAQTLSPGTEAAHIEIPYQPAAYTVTYDYSSALGAYVRSVGGTTLSDSNTNGQISVDNVIVMYTDIVPIPKDPLLKVNIRLQGTGDAVLYTKGQAYRGIWQHTNADTPIVFLNAEGEPLPLQPGNTWVSVIDSSALPQIESVMPEAAPQLTP